ncbi:MAG TPA: oxygenase MpaB family protein [Pyrinomonadaceae bacterium]|nr:oxygenase MpaB family protein [Pyrinomonadaceae bacterium]
MANRDFVHHHSIVRTIWGNPDLVLLIFAGSAAEFALNRAVDWLFFTGEIPRDPIGRLFSTVRYAQEIVFVDDATAHRTLERINTQHAHVEHQRRQTIPDWAFRDVLYMLIDYSERAYALLYRPLSQREKNDLFEVFIRIGEAMYIPELPKTYAEWQADRRRHLVRDLSYSKHTSMLYKAYRKHLGVWRYYVLLEVQALLVPNEVRRLLRLNSNPLISGLAKTYGIIGTAPLQSLVHTLLIPPRFWSDVRSFDRTAIVLQ